MPLFRRKKVFAAAVETVPGTAETLAGSDAAFNAYNFGIQLNVPNEEREGQGSFGRLPSVPGGRQGVARFRTDMGWDGTSTLPTWATVLFPACGLVNSSGTFYPTSEAPGSNVKTLTIGEYTDGKYREISGAMGNFQMYLPSGRMAYIEWEFMGAYNEDDSDVSLLTPTYPTAFPIKFNSATVSFNSENLKVEQAVLNPQNNVILREDATTVSGFSTALVTDRNPRLNVNPESVLIATKDRISAWMDSTEAALSIVLDAPSDADITIAAPKAQIFNMQQSDRNGMVVDDIELALNQNASTADQDFSITFNELTP